MTLTIILNNPVYYYNFNRSQQYAYHEIKISFHPFLWIKVQEDSTCLLIDKKWWFVDIFQPFSEGLLNSSNLIVSDYRIFSNIQIDCLQSSNINILKRKFLVVLPHFE